MTTLQAYQLLLDKVNRNDTNDNIHVSRGRFVSLYNEMRSTWLDAMLDKNRGSKEIDEARDVLEDDVPLVFLDKRRGYNRYALPEDFFETSSLYVLASKGTCTDRPLVGWEIKPSEKSTLLTDKNTGPSFEYEETLYLVTGRALNVYFSDFEITDAFFSYYRLPRAIDLEGYLHLDGSPSKTIDPDLSDGPLVELINLCAAEVLRAYQNGEGLQFAKDRN